jgi:hypothetical protein
MNENGNAQHELLRYARGMQVRVYVLRVVGGATQLWRITEEAGQPSTSIMETAFAGPDEAAAFLEEVQRTLTAGGWRPVDA